MRSPAESQQASQLLVRVVATPTFPPACCLPACLRLPASQQQPLPLTVSGWQPDAAAGIHAGLRTAQVHNSNSGLDPCVQLLRF